MDDKIVVSNLHSLALLINYKSAFIVAMMIMCILW